MNPLFAIDFYKWGHVHQYPPDTTRVWSNWTPRYTHVDGATSVVHFGLQYFIKRYLVEMFNENFFRVPLASILEEYRAISKLCLGVDNPVTAHIEQLHGLGYLPLDIYSIPEGDATPLKVPSLVITNTDSACFWLPNYIESLMSAILWRPSTSATTARRYRKIFETAAKRYYGDGADLGFVNWQGHDFSFRGMGGLEDAILSGMGHLTSFSGTDTIPAILGARQYYGADLTVGGSVPATEHSVMSAYGDADEFETFKRLLTKVYPTGVVSVVSDTWDLWRVLTDYVPRLRDLLAIRQGKLVIRPDSGDPVKIICGDSDAPQGSPASQGTLRLLRSALGSAEGMINGAGAIYGDSITPQRATDILAKSIDMGLSPYNMVFGIGSYTYAYVTRDTYGFAMKATAVRREDKIIPIFKDPVTDDGGKRSIRGIPIVQWKSSDGPDHGYSVSESVNPNDLDNCAMHKVFSNGQLLVEENFAVIRQRVKDSL